MISLINRSQIETTAETLQEEIKIVDKFIALYVEYELFMDNHFPENYEVSKDKKRREYKNNEELKDERISINSYRIILFEKLQQILNCKKHIIVHKHDDTLTLVDRNNYNFMASREFFYCLLCPLKSINRPEV